MSRALPTGEYGYLCPSCEEVYAGEPDTDTYYRCDPDYVDHDMSNSAWTYYTRSSETAMDVFICESGCKTFSCDYSVETFKTWRCGDCGALHSNKGDADECC